MADIDPISSFPSNPLTTTFSRPSECSGIHRSSYISGVDIATSCMPSGFDPDPSSFFSPGFACPDGYVSACHENTGVESITTVTCCPKVEDVTLSCVTAKTLERLFTDQFCTWIAPEDETSMPMTLSDEGKTSTVTKGYKSPEGLNAYGVRMVYQSSDLEEATMTAPPDSDGPAGDSDGDGDGLSTGAKAAIGVVVPVVVIAIAVAAFFFIRHRRRAARGGSAAGAVAEADSKTPPVYGGGPMAPPPPPTELPATNMGPVELPAKATFPPGNALPRRI